MVEITEAEQKKKKKEEKEMRAALETYGTMLSTPTLESQEFQEKTQK